MLLAIDPGRTSGLALFAAQGELREADRYERHDLLFRIMQLSYSSFRAAIEMPRWYPHEHKIDVNDLLDLSVWVGEIKQACWSRGAAVELVFPRTWKGTVPKSIHHRRVLKALTPDEKEKLTRRPRTKKFDHNMLDAVGLGLWKIGRLRP